MCIRSRRSCDGAVSPWRSRKYMITLDIQSRTRGSVWLDSHKHTHGKPQEVWLLMGHVENAKKSELIDEWMTYAQQMSCWILLRRWSPFCMISILHVTEVLMIIGIDIVISLLLDVIIVFLHYYSWLLTISFLVVLSLWYWLLITIMIISPIPPFIHFLLRQVNPKAQGDAQTRQCSSKGSTWHSL